MVKETVPVLVRPLFDILADTGTSRLACAKLDIEGGEIEVLRAVAGQAPKISPQWTVEFHDDPEFGLCTRAEVDGAVVAMRQSGFSVLIRNWPSRTNTLFLDRKALRIGLFEWWSIKFRYQYLAWLWRKWLGI